MLFYVLLKSVYVTVTSLKFVKVMSKIFCARNISVQKATIVLIV